METETSALESENGHRDDETVTDAPLEPRRPESHLERFRTLRAERVVEKHTDLEIPGYGGELVCRYNPISWDELKRIGEKVEKMKHPRRELLGQADTLIAACEQFFVRVKGELEPLDPDDPVAIRYDDRLAKALGFDAKNSDGSAKTARQIVLETFGLAVNPELAVTAQHNELAEWMQGANQEADEELLGES
jgi:hypothetical protein